MLIAAYELEVFTPPCHPGAERLTAVAHLPIDICEVLAYLNATLNGAVLTAAGHSLLWKQDGHSVAFHSDRIAVGNMEDREAAIKELDAMIALVNHTWERRGEITPNHEAFERPTAMSLYKLLPGTNCRQCGQPTCWNFALRLASSQAEVAACRPLSEPANAERRARLEALVAPLALLA